MRRSPVVPLLDVRIDLLWCHVGLRLHVWPPDWKLGFPYRMRRWWTNPFIGPVELTLFVGRRRGPAAREGKLLDGSVSVDVGRSTDHVSFRVHPFHWRRSLRVTEGHHRTATIWCGPIWVYASKWRGEEDV